MSQSFHTFTNHLLLSIEGIEGAGKSSQIAAIEKFLQNKGFTVTLLREPGGTVFGEKLRQAILEQTTPLHPLAEALLFAAARTQLLMEKILPIMNQTSGVNAKPQAIICDRYIDSSLAYQGHARGLGVETILNLHRSFPLYYLPHLTFYLKISLGTSMKRLSLRGQKKDYFEKEKQDFFEKLIQGYDHTSTLFPDRIKTIDAEKEEAQVSHDCLLHLTSWLKQARPTIL
jgi:dTMP kinase